MKKIAFVAGWYNYGGQKGLHDKHRFVLECLYKSAKKYFLPNHDVDFIFITNDDIEIEGATTLKIEHTVEGFWHMCLMKILSLNYLEGTYDNVFVNDTDQIYVDYVDESILDQDLVFLEHYFCPLVKGIHEEVTDIVELNFDTTKERWTMGNFFGGKTEVMKDLASTATYWHDLYTRPSYNPDHNFYSRYPEELFLIKYVFEKNIPHTRLNSTLHFTAATKNNFLCDFQEDENAYSNLENIVLVHNTKKDVEVLQKIIKSFT